MLTGGQILNDMPLLLPALLALSVIASLMMLGGAIMRCRGAKLALKNSEELVRLFFEREVVGVAITSPDKRWLKVNDRLCTMLGYSREELEGFTWADLTLPDDLARDVAEYERMLAGELNEYELEKRFVRKDGSVIAVSLSVGCVRTPSGAADHFIVLLSDITERKMAEESLRESREFLSTIIDNIPNMIFIKEAETLRFVRFNSAGEKLLGYKIEDMIGKNDYDFFPKEQADFFTNKDREVLASGCMLDIPEEKIETDSGTRILHTKKIPIMGNNGGAAYLLGISEDITEIKNAAEVEERLRSQLEQSQKLESVGRLAGGVAHDFNNMLTAILGNTELAMLQSDPSHPVHASLKIIEESARRSADLVRQLLAFARRQTVAPRVLDVNDIAASLLRMLQRLMGENIELIWKPAKALRPVRIDPSQIDQILANLCVNARDAIIGVGRVTIETGNAVIDEDNSSAHPDGAPGNYVTLSVRDDGVGIRSELIGHIFEPFFTTKATGKGTGLGLATVYGIVKQNNGFIDVESEPGAGTRFVIYLPCHEGEAAELALHDTSAPAKAKGETVLLVEDEEMILHVGRAMLESLGYRVLCASTPKEAIDRVKEYTDKIDMLLTDVIMPGMNGRELSGLLHELRPGIKTLFASGYTADLIAHHGVLDEGVMFIQKPFSLHDMAEKVREVLEGE